MGNATEVLCYEGQQMTGTNFQVGNGMVLLQQDGGLWIY